MRLDAITGSIVDISTNKGARGSVSSKGLADLEDILEEFAGVAARIHGEADFTNQEAGRFSHPVSSSVSALPAMVLDAAAEQRIAKKGSGGLKVEIAGANVFKVDVNAGDRLTVAAGFVSSSVDLVAAQELKALAAGGVESGLYFRGLNQTVKAASNAIWDGAANALKVTGEISGSSALKSGGTLAVAGNATVGGTLDVDGQATLASAVVEDLTPTHVVFVGAGDVLSGSGDMTYNAGTKVLSVDGSTFGNSVTIAGDLTVNGTTTTVNSTTLQVDDKNIELAHSPSGAAGNDAAVDGGGITLVSSEGNKTITWSNTTKYWEFSEGIKAPSGSFSNLASQLVKADGAGKLLDAHAMDFITGTLNQVSLAAGSLAGSVVLSLPQSIDTSADVEFDSLKLDDLTVNRLLKTDASTKLLVSADIMDYVTGTVNQVSLAAGAFGNVVLSTPQDIHTGASPEFAAVEIGSAGDKLHMVGSDLVLSGAADLYFADAQGSFKLSEAAGDWTSFVTNFGNVSLVEALNSLAGGSVAGKGKWVKALASDIAGGAYTFVGADQIGGSTVAPDLDAVSANTEIYLNGQLMIAGADYTVSNAEVDFAFDLKADDVIVAIIR
jgi:hypothetical protein